MRKRLAVFLWLSLFSIALPGFASSKEKSASEPLGLVPEAYYVRASVAVSGADIMLCRYHARKPLASHIARKAFQYLGVPYTWGGTGTRGFDCSGLIFSLFRQFHVRLPRTADAQYEHGAPVKREKLQTGDLVFFSTYTAGVSHVGIYIGNGEFIHASPTYGVTKANLGDSYFLNRYFGARRIIHDRKD